MPNPHTIIITFPQEDVNNTPDTYDLVLTFTVDVLDDNQAITAESQNLQIKKHGSLEWDFDLEDGLLVPGDLNFELVDPDDYLAGLLFGVTVAQEATRKQFKVSLSINGTVDFLGFAVEDEIRFNHGTKILNVKAVPRIDVINKTAIVDDDDLPLDPLNYGTVIAESISNAVRRAAPNDDEVEVTHNSSADFNVGSKIVISGVVGMTDLNRAFLVDAEVSNTVFRVLLNTDQVYVATSGQCQVIGGNMPVNRSIPTVIEDIFQEVESGISISGGEITVTGPGWDMNQDIPITRDISAAAFDTPSAGRVRVTITATTGLVATDDIHINGVIGMTDLNAEFAVDNIFSATQFDVVLATAQTYTSGGKVKEITQQTWGANTFCRPVDYFDDDANGLKTLGDVLRSLARDWFCYSGMVHQERAFFKRMYTYESGNTQALGTVLDKVTRYRFGLIDYVKMTSKNSTLVKFFDAGVFTSLVNRVLKVDNVIPTFWLDVGGISFSNIPISAGGADDCFEAKDPILDDTTTGWEPHGKLLARLYLDSRDTMNKNREVTFTAVGVGYDVLQSVNHESEGFWTVGLKKDFSAGVSVLKCIFIEAT